MVGQQHKTKKKHWLKHPEAEKGNLTKIYIIQNLIFGIRFFIISAIQLYNIRSHVSVDNIRVFLNFGFSSRMSQSQQKLEKRSLILLCSFTQETSLILRTSNHLIEKNDMLLQHCKVNTFICVKLGTHNSFVL